jgi:hypothetical protein
MTTYKEISRDRLLKTLISRYKLSRTLFLLGVLRDLFACKEKAIKWSFMLPFFLGL